MSLNETQLDRGDPPPWRPELLTLGLAFVGAGGALGASIAAFRFVGAVLVFIGLAILIVSAIEPLRWMIKRRLPPTADRWTLPAVILFLVVSIGASALLWFRFQEAEPLTPLAASSVTVPSVSCIESAEQCVFSAEKRSPGEPLVWVLPTSMTHGGVDGSLQTVARLDGDVAGRYVAVACRQDTERGEYVLAVRPENRSFRLIRWDGSVRTDLADERLPDTINPANDPNRLELRCVGPQISALINETPVANVNDGHLMSGNWYVAAGIFAENTQPASVSARFEHIAITQATPVS